MPYFMFSPACVCERELAAHKLLQRERERGGGREGTPADCTCMHAVKKGRRLEKKIIGIKK